ncbi:hypothetical protein GCM10009738_19880 [Kitasatospora viridis]
MTVTQSPRPTVAPSPSTTVLTTNCPVGLPDGRVITALLPTEPLTVGIGDAEETAAGTDGAELVGAGDGPLFTEELLLHAASSASIGRSTSNPALRRTGTVPHCRSHLRISKRDQSRAGPPRHRGGRGRPAG